MLRRYSPSITLSSSSSLSVSSFVSLTTQSRTCATKTETNNTNKAQQQKTAEDEKQQQQQEEDPEKLLQRLRKDTDREFYEPGPVAKAMRKVVVKTTQTFGVRKKVAQRMEKGLKDVAKMEDEAKWLRAHGSPLRVLGLPDSADLDDVKARYRNLLFEVHPDTSSREDKKALAKLGLSEDQIRSRQQTEFDLLKEAYRMAITPTSLWHQDGNAPALLRELQPNLTLFQKVVNAQTVFPVASWLYMIGVLFVVFSVIGKWVLDNGLYLTDPQFYGFMYKQEAEERKKREAGEEVDYNPKRLAPTRFKRVSSPGLYVNNVIPPEEDSGFWQDE